jgi:hypothetical protein
MPLSVKWWKKSEYPERTTDHGQKYRPKVKNGVGGIPTTKNLNQFFYQFSSVSGKVLTKSKKLNDTITIPS